MAGSLIGTTLLIRLGQAANWNFVLPMLIVYPTSRCNSRCISCDWWKSTGENDLTLAELSRLADSLPALGTRLVLFSGGEPLLRADVFEAAELFRRRGIALHLLTSGVLLERFAPEIVGSFERVIVSLDGSTEDRYRAIRGINGLSVLEAGVARVKSIRPGLPLTARATLHRENYRELPCLIDKAKAMGLDGVSFLAADVASEAFGRHRREDLCRLLLDREEVAEFRAIVRQVTVDYGDDFASGFIAESPAKLSRLPQHYAAMLGDEPFPSIACNAPWVSAVIEADGNVRPCFFHQAVGNIRDRPLAAIVRHDLRAFRAGLDLWTDNVCRRCVCSLKVGWRHQPWQ
jgi:MoaA/NifB/PqqE/SkfB family radical SAM enzyme